MEKLIIKNGGTLTPIEDGLSYRAVFSTSDVDCAYDRLLDWSTSDELPVQINHSIALDGVKAITDRPHAPGQLAGTIRFPRPGVSAEADLARARVASGELTGVSIGFIGAPIPNGLGDGVKSGRDFGMAYVEHVAIVTAGSACCADCAITARKSVAAPEPRYSLESLALALRADRLEREAAETVEERRARVKAAFASMVFPITRTEVKALTIAALKGAVAQFVAYHSGSIDGETPKRYAPSSCSNVRYYHR